MVMSYDIIEVEMKFGERQFIVLLIVLGLFLIQGASGLQVTSTSGSNGISSSVDMNIGAAKDTVVGSQITINGAYITPAMALTGPVPSFSETHSFADKSGKSVTVSANVINAASGITYKTQILPVGADPTKTYPSVSAEQWLTVPKADSIKCKATSTYGTTRSASVGLEEYKGTLAGDYVTLTGYYGKAVTTGTSVLATQSATSGTASTIKIYGSAKDSSESYSVNTPLKGLSGGKATFNALSETSSAGTTNQVVQKEHLHGTFTSTVTYTPTTGTPKIKTRTSNYGADYDLTIAAKKYVSGTSIWGTLGYYVKPTTSANKIQGAVNMAQSGDTINVATGTYKENVQIDKSLTVKGAGSTKTIVDGNKAGSVFTTGYSNPNVDVTLSGMTIQGGSGKSITSKYGTIGVCGGGVLNYGKLSLTGCIISGNTAGFLGGGIYNVGTLKVLDKSTIAKNTAGWGGGFYNYGTTIVKDSNILGNTAHNGGGGIYACCSSLTTLIGSKISGNIATGIGGGIAAQGALTVQGSTISGNTANLGGGICWKNKRPIIDSTTVITGNSNPQVYPY